MPGQRQPTGQVLALCLETMARPVHERMVFLSEACGDDFRLRASVEAVLVTIKDAQTFMDAADAGTGAFRDRVGDVLGNYRVEAFVGEGRLGAVFRARREDTARPPPVALRVLRGHLLARELIERFVNEVRALRAVRHPCLAGLIDGGVSASGTPYLIYEWIEGVRIDDHCDRQRLDVRARVALLERLCDAVQRAHQHLVACCGVAAANVLVTGDGDPKLLDFASAAMVWARWPQGAQSAFESPAQALARDYCAPELLLHARVTTAGDVYALGVLACELLTGERPCRLDGQDAQQQAATLDLAARVAPAERVRANIDWAQSKAIAHRRGTTPGRLIRLLEGDLDGIVLGALNFDPTRRYPSAAALAADLAAWRHGRHPLPSAGASALPRRQGLARALMAVAALVLLLIATSAL